MKSCVAVLSRLKTLPSELRTKLPKVNFVEILNEIDHEKLYDSEIVIADFDLLNPHLDKLRNTKWIQGTWAGVDKLVPYKNSIRSDIIVSRFSGIHFGRLMSEYVVANIVNYERNLFTVYDNKKNKTWKRPGKILIHRAISDLTIGILGVGTIGNHIAKTLSLFGATLWGCGRSEKNLNDPEYSHFKNYCTTDNLSLLLKNCDYVINVLPNTDDTTGLLNGEILKNCEGKETVFINIGRGNIIADDDLIHALKNKWVTAAILDVFNKEPLPENHKLWEMEQVFITPHVAGVSRAKDIAELFSSNLEYYLSGKTIPTQFFTDKNY